MHKDTCFYYIGYLLAAAFTLLVIFHSNFAEADARKLTGVRIEGISETEEPLYLGVLAKLAQDAIEEFLRERANDPNLNVSMSEMASEIGTVDLAPLKEGGKCLFAPNRSATLRDISQAIKGGCVVKDQEFISALMLSRSFGERGAEAKFQTSFFPYGLERLKALESPLNNTIDYEEKYSTGPLTEVLVVLGFLNLYWDQIKDNTKLTPVQWAIVFHGFGSYSLRLKRLCDKMSGTPQLRCRNVYEDAQKIPSLARAKIN